MDKYVCPVLCMLSCITHEFIGDKSGWILQCASQQKVFLILSLLVAHFTMSFVEGEEYLPCSTHRGKRPSLSPAETVCMHTGDHIVALA